MTKRYLPAIDYIRGISMLGVVSIHVGSEYLLNPHANIHLITLLEIITRFSIPIFFFISAFGMFYHLEQGEVFSYNDFIKRRFRTVFFPYLLWSFFYILFDHIVWHEALPDLFHLMYLIFFGLAKYHLYFMVLLLWFYLCMPLWIKIVCKLNTKRLFYLLILQIVFNYISSYLLWGLSFGSKMLDTFLIFRLNYWILHYVFIFLLGAYLAQNFDDIMPKLKRQLTYLSLLFWGTLGGMLFYYYKLIFMHGYSAEACVNTVHQLSPVGVLYTICTSLFFFTYLSTKKIPPTLQHILSFLGFHSYFIYLFHPVAITYLSLLFSKISVLHATHVIIFYMLTLFISILVALCMRKIGVYFPLLDKITIGVYRKSKN